jgi:GxxExxY protein
MSRSAIAVHKELGPGFLESIYEEAIAFELNEQKIPYQRQLPIFIRYKEKVIGMHRLDLLVEDKIVVELKAVKDIDDSHLATCLSYLKATGLEVGLIINFYRATIRVRRVVRTTALTAEVGDAEGAESFF